MGKCFECPGPRLSFLTATHLSLTASPPALYSACIDSIKRLGLWKDSVCTDAYAVHAPKDALLAMAGFMVGGNVDLHKVCYHNRLHIAFTGPELTELQNCVHPWLSDFTAEVDKVVGNKASPRNCLLFLTALCQVLIQDAVHAAVVDFGNHSALRPKDWFP